MADAEDERRVPRNPALAELHERLGELHRSAELLGTQGRWEQEDGDGAPPGPAPGATEYSYPPAAGGEPPRAIEVPRYEPEPARPAAEAAPPPAPAPAPAPRTPAVSGPSSSVTAIVDAGPINDLIELRRFEEDLTTLPIVRDVRVRRFGKGRASIEVGLTGPYALERELGRLGGGITAEPGADGELILELERAVAPDGEPEDED